MKKSLIFKLLSVFVFAAMILAACGGDATEEPADTTDAGDAADTGDAADAGDALDNPYDEIPYGDPLVLDAGSCDYGGKVKAIEAMDEFTVRFTLCGPDPAFLAKIAFTPFGIQPREYFEYTGGTGDLLDSPVGTGPYMVEEWVRGEQVTYTRFDDYWGELASAQTAVLKWSTEGAARLLELQAGTADYIWNLSPDDYAVVEDDPNLVLIPDLNPNILYIAMTNTFAPWDNVDVRRAVAMGIDRDRIVTNFFPGGSEVASHFTPCSIPNGCEGDAWYGLDLDAANAMLDAAGFPRGDDGVRFTTAIYYRDVFRVYLPEPGLVAVELQTQLLENLGIDAEVIVMESGEFIAASTDGQLDGIYMLGWGADYPHVTNFLDFHFNEGNPQFGDTHAAIYGPLLEASQIADLATAAPLYAAANNAIRELVPMIPVVHGANANAAQASLVGAYKPPFGAVEFYLLDNGTDTLVLVQNAEPISLYCADETDGESLRPCQQVVESLLEYATNSGDTVPALATACTSNDDASVWTCTLREDVLFHDGSKFDANDVVASWAAGLDASNPFHVGNTGGFDYFAYLWDGLINAEE